MSNEEEAQIDDDKKLPPLSVEEEQTAQGGEDGDSLSTEETIQLSSGLTEKELRKTALENEADRTENFRNHFERLAIGTLYVAWVVLIAIGLAWVYHLLAPPTLPRLPDEQVRQLQSIITGSILAGIAGGHVKRRLNQ